MVFAEDPVSHSKRGKFKKKKKYSNPILNHLKRKNVGPQIYQKWQFWPVKSDHSWKFEQF